MSFSSTNSTGAELPPDLAQRVREAPGPQTLRVHAVLRDAILQGELPAGRRLPPSRTLAVQLGVARHAVVGAYEALQGDGLAVARVGAGTQVADRLPGLRAHAAAPARPATVPPASGPFVLGRPTADPPFQRRYARAVQRLLADPGLSALGYGDPLGARALREQIALQLRLGRGLRCGPEQVLVTTGVQQVLRLCAQALLRPGDGVLFEDPGYPTARRTLQAAGLRPHPVAVDAEGLDLRGLRGAARRARAAYVTPSHQFPTGVAMSLPRRLALLDWAHREQAWVLEDDYDSEFRYHGPALTSLAGLDGGRRVIYIGTFSKSTFPALRLAYAVLPAEVVAPVIAARQTFDRFSPTPLEQALAELMADGGFAQHLRRIRPACRRARDTLVDALRDAAGDALTVQVPDQGLHLLAHLPPGSDPALGRAVRAACGLDLLLLSDTRARPSDGPDAFVLGFSGVEPDALVAAAQRLGAAVRQATGRRPRP